MIPGTIAFHHFGCKVNFAEASALSREFKDNGWVLTGFHEKADVYVISTCIVTGIAEKKCRAAIRRVHKLNPRAQIAVIGCFPELKPEVLRKMDGVSLVLGHSGKFNLYRELTDPAGIGHSKVRVIKEKNEKVPFISSYSQGDRTRSFVKIQDGCNYFCSYCTIPLARGESRSDSVAHVLKTVEKVAVNGVKEIVLTGVNIGDFGSGHGETFLQLLTALEDQQAVPRIRISSVEPDLLHNPVIDLVANSKIFQPHFHIPLQSGCNKILNAMHRRYDRELYHDRVTRIRSILPMACIAADVIAGFPGETEEDFLDTFRFLETLPVSYMHVFTYSKRENTPASTSPGQVDDPVKKERSDRLHSLSARKKNSFYLENQGKEAFVLWESDNISGCMFGFTENYIRVKTAFQPEWVNQIMKIRPRRIDNDGCYLIK